MTAILHRGLRIFFPVHLLSIFYFDFYTLFLFGLLFPFSIWTFVSLFYLDFYFIFLFGLFNSFSFLFQFFSILFQLLFFHSIAVKFWISSNFFNFFSILERCACLQVHCNGAALCSLSGNNWRHIHRRVLLLWIVTHLLFRYTFLETGWYKRSNLLNAVGL